MLSLFKIFMVQRQMRSGESKPSDFILDEILGFLKGYIYALIFIFLPILLLTGFFGLTSFAGGPYGVARFLFWFFFVIFAFVFLILTWIYLKFRNWILRHRRTIKF